MALIGSVWMSVCASDLNAHHRLIDLQKCLGYTFFLTLFTTNFTTVEGKKKKNPLRYKVLFDSYAVFLPSSVEHTSAKNTAHNVCLSEKAPNWMMEIWLVLVQIKKLKLCEAV